MFLFPWARSLAAARLFQLAALASLLQSTFGRPLTANSSRRQLFVQHIPMPTLSCLKIWNGMPTLHGIRYLGISERMEKIDYASASVKFLVHFFNSNVDQYCSIFDANNLSGLFIKINYS
jgi:hypothetical protein